MQISAFKKTVLATVITASCLSNLVLAEEGGTGHYAIGGMATMSDLPPTKPGWVVQPLYLHYEGSTKDPLPAYVPVLKSLNFKIDAKVDALVLGGVYTFEEKVLGAYYSVGVYAPYVNMDIKATIVRPGGAVVEQHEVAAGLGDMTFVPLMLAWKQENWQYSFALPVYAPTGEYDKDNLANQGVNYWTLDPTAIITYANETTGFNATISSGVTFNSRNEATHYKSGSIWHAEASIQQLLPLGPGYLTIGVNGFIYEQIEEDRVSDELDAITAKFDGFKGSSYGIGPVIGYVYPTEDSGTGILEVRWLPELSTKNRLEGDYIWIKGGWMF